MTDYDSAADTLSHISAVRIIIGQMVKNLWNRADIHDASKLESPEKEVFDVATPKLRGLTYGSPEYYDSLKEMGAALRHHYNNNSHHPEHFDWWFCPLCEGYFEFSTLKPCSHVTNADDSPIYLCPKCCANGSIYEAILEPGHGIAGMSLFDLIEMLADWKAATERHADGNMRDSLAKNEKRFKIPKVLAQILENTLIEIGW